MRKLITVVPLLILALILNAETAREKLERNILGAYSDMGFYSGSIGRGMDFMVTVTVSDKEPYDIYIWFRKNMPQRRQTEAIILGVATVGKETARIKEETFTVWFSTWDSDHKKFEPFATIQTEYCRQIFKCKTDEEKNELLKKCLIFYE